MIVRAVPSAAAMLGAVLVAMTAARMCFQVLLLEARRKRIDVRRAPRSAEVGTYLPAVMAMAVKPALMKVVARMTGEKPRTEMLVVNEMDAGAMFPAVAMRGGPGWRTLLDNMRPDRFEGLGVVGQNPHQND